MIPARCPGCGGSFGAPPGTPVATCPFCRRQVHVPPAANNNSLWIALAVAALLVLVVYVTMDDEGGGSGGPSKVKREVKIAPTAKVAPAVVGDLVETAVRDVFRPQIQACGWRAMTQELRARIEVTIDSGTMSFSLVTIALADNADYNDDNLAVIQCVEGAIRYLVTHGVNAPDTYQRELQLTFDP